MNLDVTGSPVRFNAKLGRRLRQDDLETLGISTLTLTETALERRDWSLTHDLATYFLEELKRGISAIRAWLQDLYDQGFIRSEAAQLLQSNVFELLCRESEIVFAKADQSLIRDQLATVHQLGLERHDQLVSCVQFTLSDLASRHGEQAVFDSIERTNKHLWGLRMTNWFDLSLRERVWLSAELIRGHLSGSGRRGDLRILDEPEAIVLELDPCGCCGILRRGESPPTGNLEPHAWTGQRTNLGWYASHVFIANMYLPMRSGLPPYRTLEQCDTTLPCRWLLEKIPGFKPITKYKRSCQIV
jgi:hypothetical protein